MKCLLLASVISMLVAVNTMAYATEYCNATPHNGPFTCTLSTEQHNTVYFNPDLTCQVTSGSGYYEDGFSNNQGQVGPDTTLTLTKNSSAGVHYSLICTSGSFTVDCKEP